MCICGVVYLPWGMGTVTSADLGGVGAPAYAAVLRHAFRSSDLSYRGLAQESGLSVSHLQRLLGGKIASPTAGTLRAVAGPLGLDARLLISLL